MYWMDWFRHGGPVLWLLMIMGLASVVVYIERALHLHRARINHRDFLNGIFNVLRRGNFDEAMTISADTPGPIASLVRMAVMHRDEPRDVIRQALNEVGRGEISRMERRLVALATIAQTAPLLGLLGTILGILETLLMLRTQAPVVQAMDLTDGVMRALITTGAGLMVALPCYVLFNLLVIKIDRIVLDMEQAATEVTAFLSRRPSDGETAT